MAKKWNELTDAEQEEAVGLLHHANHTWRELYNGPNAKLDLIETAINTIDDSRRKFQKKRGMTDYGAGVVVLLFNFKGEVLVGKRKGSHGAGTWSLPGGRLEFMESALMRAHIELAEETGIEIPVRDFIQREWVDNIWEDKDKGQQHWVSLFVQARSHRMTPPPRVMEPDKCEEWKYAASGEIIHELPLFPPLKRYIDTYGLFEK